MGIDAWGWDRPFWAMREEWLRSKVSCLLVNLRGGSAGWTRAVAIIGD